MLGHIRTLGLEEAWLETGDADADRLVEVAIEANMRVERFGKKQMLRGQQCQISPRSMVVGGLTSTRSALRALGRELPAWNDYPDELTPFPLGAFVCEGRVLGVRHYWGDETASPEGDTVTGMVHRFAQDAPAAYALDIGVLNSGETAPIEATDGFALDAYGLNPTLYFDVVATRWRQLVGPVTNDA